MYMTGQDMFTASNNRRKQKAGLQKVNVKLPGQVGYFSKPLTKRNVNEDKEILARHDVENRSESCLPILGQGFPVSLQ